MATWRDTVRDEVAGISDGPAHLTALAAGTSTASWTHADAPGLVGLERWGTELAGRDLAAGIGALVTAARAGFPRIVEAGGEDMASMGLVGEESDRIVDGAAVQVQLARAARWLDAPDATLAAVNEAFDRTRQLYVWDEDLLPTDDAAHYWYLDVGQCCLAAITSGGGSADGGGYYEWPPEVTVGRGLVAVARALRHSGTSTDAVLADLWAALAAV